MPNTTGKVIKSDCGWGNLVILPSGEMKIQWRNQGVEVKASWMDIEDLTKRPIYMDEGLRIKVTSECHNGQQRVVLRGETDGHEINPEHLFTGGVVTGFHQRMFAEPTQEGRYTLVEKRQISDSNEDGPVKWQEVTA